MNRPVQNYCSGNLGTGYIGKLGMGVYPGIFAGSFYLAWLLLLNENEFL
jgi:hypothetical protein